MDEPLLPRVAAGDASAVSECLARYGGLVWSLARRKSPTPADAEDAAQEIFIDLWRSAARFDPAAGSEVTFVAVIARRRLIDRLRKSGRQPEVLPLPAHEQLPALLEPDRPALGDEARLAAEHLATLRPDERKVLELAIFHGLSHAGIAAATGLPLGSVKSHARRGLMSLREKMGAARTVAVAGGEP